jgi:hypothetical protein
MTRIESQGYWWLPETPDEQIAGILRYDPDGAELELLGLPKGYQQLFQIHEVEIFLGLDTEGREITLHDCGGSSSFQSPGVPRSSYHANLVLIGGHFEHSADLHFHTILARFSNLDVWAGKPTVKSELTGNRFQITYEPPPDVLLLEDPRLRVSLHWRRAGPVGLGTLREASIRQEAWFKIEYPEEQPIRVCQKDLGRIQNFLSLACMSPCLGKKTLGRTGQHYIDVGTKRHDIDIEIHPLYSTPKGRELDSPTEMLFALSDIECHGQKILQSWFERSAVLEPVHSLYFGTLYRSALYPHHRFLSLVQAAESFHRVAAEKDAAGRQRHKERVQEVLASAPDVHRDWLAAELQFSKVPLFRERMQDLVDRFVDLASGCFGDPGQFVTDLKNTRNYFTHFGQELKPKAADGTRLLILTERLRLLLEMCFVTDLGFAGQEISAMLKRTQRLTLLRRNLSTWERFADSEGEDA